jgi:hypothetical protein
MALAWAICSCGRTLSRADQARAVTLIRERACPAGACLRGEKVLDQAVWRALRLKPVVVSIEKGAAC